MKMDPKLGVGGYLAAVGLAWSASAVAVPLDVSGSLGYTYRALDTEHRDATSNQLLGQLGVRSYLWRPWLATTEANLTATLDTTEVDDGTGTATKESQIYTGDLSLNVLPQSRVPFRAYYQQTDSRISNTTIHNPLITLAGEEYSTTHLELRQSYVTEEGHRLQAQYDTRSWESERNGSFDDEQIGLELDWRPANQRLTARASQKASEHSRSDRHRDTLIVDLDHFYLPNEDLRMDNRISRYDFKTDFEGATGITGRTRTEINQASSFLFWRPDERPWTVSGGIRATDMAGSTAVSETDQRSISANLGSFYRYSNRLRLDASASVTNLETDVGDTTTSRQSLGALYQSDLYNPAGFTYKWFTRGDVENRTDSNRDDDSEQAANLRLGHDLNRTWIQGPGASWRVNLSQTLNENWQSDDTAMAHRLDHSATVGWNRSAGEGTTMVELILSDARDLSGDNEHQMANLQLSRHQTVSRRSSFSGHLTLQTVRQAPAVSGQDDTVTTATGQLNYEHSRLFAITHLSFMSDLYISLADATEERDRTEWENRLDYAIGLTNASLSYRLMEDGGEESSLLYFRVTRRF